MTKLLIIEDAPDMRVLLKQYFTVKGFAVAVAADGTTGLELARSEQPNLIILDLALPDISGLEVCRQIREIMTTPVIILSARNSNEQILQGFAMGADDYVTKPFDADVLLARVRAVLNRAGGSVA